MKHRLNVDPSVSYLSWSLSSAVEQTFQVLGDFRLSAFMPDHRCPMVKSIKDQKSLHGFITLEDAVKNRNWIRFETNGDTLKYENLADLVEDGWLVDR